MGAYMLNIFKTAADINKKRRFFFKKKKKAIIHIFHGSVQVSKVGHCFCLDWGLNNTILNNKT